LTEAAHRKAEKSEDRSRNLAEQSASLQRDLDQAYKKIRNLIAKLVQVPPTAGPIHNENITIHELDSDNKGPNTVQILDEFQMTEEQSTIERLESEIASLRYQISCYERSSENTLDLVKELF
jgi:hypothetical protein